MYQICVNFNFAIVIILGDARRCDESVFVYKFG